MEWTGEGILLSARPHGENAAIIDVLTAEHGLHRGVVRGGTGRRMAPVLQPGAQLHLTWRARLDTHLGHFSVELLRARAAAVMHDRDRLAALNALCALAAFALPERTPQARLYAASEAVLDLLMAAAPWYGAYLAWERLLLEETGYGLDLSACAVTGTRDGLAHVSPRSGRAVSAAGAGAWASKLLPLPPLLLDPGTAEERGQMAAGLRTLGYFLDHVLAPALGTRPMPEARTRLAARFS